MSRNDALLEAFAAELKARRAGLKLSQEEIAYRAGVNRMFHVFQWIYHWK